MRRGPRDQPCIPHLKVNNLNACPAGRDQNVSRWSDCLLNAGDVDPGSVKHPTLGAEVILHVYDDHDSFGGIERNRFRLRVESNSLAGHFVGFKLSIQRQNREDERK